jgi:hypothetical protein
MIDKLIGSFDNVKGQGFSARKLTSFALMLCIAFIHFRFVDNSNAIEALIIDLSGVLLCLGIITAQNVIELRNNSNNQQNAT